MASTCLSSLTRNPILVNDTLGALAEDERITAITTFLEDFERKATDHQHNFDLAGAVIRYIRENDIAALVNAYDSQLIGSVESQIAILNQRNVSDKSRKYLAEIREQSGWEHFPACLPPAMKSTKRKSRDTFGTTMLGAFRNLAKLASFPDVLKHFERLSKDKRITLETLKETVKEFETRRAGSVCARRCIVQDERDCSERSPKRIRRSVERLSERSDVYFSRPSTSHRNRVDSVGSGTSHHAIETPRAYADACDESLLHEAQQGGCSDSDLQFDVAASTRNWLSDEQSRSPEIGRAHLNTRNSPAESNAVTDNGPWIEQDAAEAYQSRGATPFSIPGFEGAEWLHSYLDGRDSVLTVSEIVRRSSVVTTIHSFIGPFSSELNAAEQKLESGRLDMISKRSRLRELDDALDNARSALQAMQAERDELALGQDLFVENATAASFWRHVVSEIGRCSRDLIDDRIQEAEKQIADTIDSRAIMQAAAKESELAYNTQLTTLKTLLAEYREPFTLLLEPLAVYAMVNGRMVRHQEIADELQEI